MANTNTETSRQFYMQFPWELLEILISSSYFLKHVSCAHLHYKFLLWCNILCLNWWKQSQLVITVTHFCTLHFSFVELNLPRKGIFTAYHLNKSCLLQYIQGGAICQTATVSNINKKKLTPGMVGRWCNSEENLVKLIFTSDHKAHEINSKYD